MSVIDSLRNSFLHIPEVIHYASLPIQPNSHCTSSGVFNGMVCLFAWNSPPKYSFNHCVLTLNVPFSRCVTFAPPCGKTLVTVKGPDHLDFNFPGKSLSRELNKRTCCPASNSFLAMCLSCQAFVFSLYMRALSYASLRNFSNSLSCSNCLSPANVLSMFNYRVAQ